MKKLLLALILAVFNYPAFAEIPATPLPTDTRLVVFTYDPNNSFAILLRPKSITDIQMGPDEKIKSFALGDTIQWEWSKTGDSQHLFLKPKFENINTSATLITTKRTYQLLLYSSTIDGKWYQRVTWESPDMVMLDETSADKDKQTNEVDGTSAKLSPGTAVENLNFNYSIDGDAAFRPVTVIDDGQFTFLRMPPKTMELPALFLITPEGDTELINYIVRGDYLVIQRLVDKVLLKIGKQEVRITKANPNRRTFFDMFKSK